MTRALEIARIVECAALVALAVVLSILAVHAIGVVTEIGATVDQASGAIAILDATLLAIERPCGNRASCGTLADVAKTLNTVRGATGEIEIAAKHEDARIGALDSQEAQIYADTHGALQNANDSLKQLHSDLQTADKAIGAMQPVESNLNDEVAAMQTATANVTALVANKDLQETLKNSADASKSMAAIADDTRQAVHNYLHPKWPRKVWNAVTGVGLTALKIVW